MTTDLELIIGDRNYSSWSLRGYLALSLAGLEFRETLIQLDQAGTRAAILARSPAGKVPALVHGDLLIWDTLAIGEYAAELAPGAGLWPADRAARAVARSVVAEMHSGFPALRKDMAMNLRARRPGVGHTEQALAEAARVQAIWRDCRGRFGEAGGGEFLFGGPTLAEAFYAPVVTRFVTYGVELDPVCQRYADAVLALPAMVRWTEAALAEDWVMEHSERR